MSSLLPWILVMKRSSGRGAGPPSTCPSIEKRDVWHGQMKVRLGSSQWYAQPKCVHCGKNATTSLFGCFTTQAVALTLVTFHPSTRVRWKEISVGVSAGIEDKSAVSTHSCPLRSVGGKSR